MPTAKLMVEKVAELTGEPLTVCQTIDVSLSTAGLRTKGPRGPGAPDMTPRDAAWHLLATMTARHPTRSAAEAMRIGGLEAEGGFEDPFHRDLAAPFERLRELRRGHPLIAAIETLITILPEALIEDGARIGSFSVEIDLTLRRAEIGFSPYLNRTGEPVRVLYAAPEAEDANFSSERSRRIAVIGGDTLLKLGAFLKGDLEFEPPAPAHFASDDPTDPFNDIAPAQAERADSAAE